MSLNGFLLIAGSSVVILCFQVEIFRRLRKYNQRLEREHAQASQETKLYQVLDIKRPLPSMRGWTISPDMGWIYVSKIFERRPTTILECGSGVSTLLAAYALRDLGDGKVIALEHDEAFADQTRKQIHEHRLEAFAQVVFTPLIKHVLDGQEFLWYDLKQVALPEHIDLLFVDGPPGHLQPLSRYGAIPLLRHRLHEKSSILLDDTNRTDEKTIIDRWKKDFFLEEATFKAEKGATLLTFKPFSQPEPEHEERPKFE